MLEVQRRLVALRDTSGNGRPLYERVAHELAQAIRMGELQPGERLPSVRQLATDAGLSVTTVMSVYTRLADSGLVYGEAGRGTFVSESPDADGAAAPPRAAEQHASSRQGSAWRRRVLAQTEARLKQSFPMATDVMRGGPELRLLPLEVIRDAFLDVASRLGTHDLEYPSTLSVEPALTQALHGRLLADGLRADADDMLVASSTQQFLAMLAMLLRQRFPAEPVLVGIEEPGYQTAMDTFEVHGLGLVPIPLDQAGATPDGLASALNAGVAAVFLTPRAQSPAGCSWTADRRQELADGLAAHPEVWIIEDDHFAEASASHPGSLYSDPRLRDRVVYLRSFSKSIAPDLRLSVAVVRPPIRHPLTMAKSFNDGWTSRTSQRVLAAVLSDPRTDDVLRRARTEYARRRAALREAILSVRDTHGIDLSVPEAGPDGLHVWVTLPRGCDADRVAEAAAQRGFLLAAGQPFFVSPGDQRHLRLNAGTIAVEASPKIAAVVHEAIVSVLGQPTALLTP